MENKTEFIERESKQSHYDKRLINEVVKLVEEGTPRKEVNRIYHLGVSTLNGWMRDYVSASYHAGKKRSYTPVEKNKIIAEIEQGLSLSEIQKKYTVRSKKTLRTWIRKSKNENSFLTYPTRNEMTRPKNESCPDSTEIHSLQKVLEEANLKIKALNMMIDLAEQELKIEIRKKSGTKQSGR